MGAAKQRRQRFLEAHPICAFCGGAARATTVEHCPPRAMFQFRQWPEGFEFPACSDCNNGSDDQDLLVAMLARMDPITHRGDLDGRVEGMMKLANRQFPGMFARMLPSAVEARQSNRKRGVTPKPGQTQQEAGGINVTPEMHEAVCVLARKLVKGIYYREARRIFPSGGCLLMHWFTNADADAQGRYPAFELLREMGGNAPLLERAGKYLNDQFEFKYGMSADRSLIALQAKFGNAFGFVVFGSTTAGRLEAMVERLRAETAKQGPFAVLQSLTLATSRSSELTRPQT
jgi:hypothetical protein